MRTPRTLRALSAVIVLALGAAACGDEADEDPLGGDTTTSTTAEVSSGGGDDGGSDGTETTVADPDEADVPDGWQLVEGDGVSIAVPGGWMGVPLEDFDLGGEDLQEVLPNADEALLNQAAQVVRQGGVLLAFGPLDEMFTDNINILAMPIPATMSQLEQEARLGMDQLGADVISIDQVELPVGPAVRVEYTLDLQGPDGPATVEGIQFFVPQDRMTYVITVSTQADPGAVADDMAETFRVA